MSPGYMQVFCLRLNVLTYVVVNKVSVTRKAFVTKLQHYENIIIVKQIVFNKLFHWQFKN